MSTFTKSTSPQPMSSTTGFQYKSEKVIEIFESPYTEQLADRKAVVVVKFCKERKEGFRYADLENLIKIVNYAIADLKEGVGEMNNALTAILECASRPFIKERAGDELQYVPLLPYFLNTIKPLMINGPFKEDINKDFERFPNNISPKLRFTMIKFLKNFCSEGIDEILQMEESLNEKNAKMQFDLSPMQRLLQRAMDKSDLVEDIIFTMQYFNKDYDFLLPLLDMISNCVLYKNLAQKFTNFGILKDIIYVIFECEDFRSYIVKSCFEIIWNSIEAVGIDAIQLFATEDIIYSLKKLFENIMKNGYKLEDKCLRNELLILINYLMSNEKALYFFYEKQNVPSVQSPATFLDILLFYSTIDEITFYNQPIRTNNLKSFFGTTSEDLEFKKLIWSTVLTAIQSNQTLLLESVKNSPFVMSLLLYIDPLANSYAVNRWSAPQLREIQLHCLSVLANVILYIKEDFYEKGGLLALTKFLTNNTDPERREKCLRAFNNAAIFDENYKLKITEEGVLDNLIDLLSSENTVGDSSYPLEIRELCFSIISNLCQNCFKNQKLFRKKGGIDLIVTALKDSNVAQSTRYALYAVAILDCLWNAILGNKRNETIFLDNESIPYFCDWNSTKTMINATQLLIKIYEKEDIKYIVLLILNRYGVKYDDGIIVNYNRPLNPRSKKIKIKSMLGAINEADASREFEDFNENTRSVKDPRNVPSNIKGFQRLKEALKASENDSEAGTEAYLVKRIREKLEEYDFRAIIFCILYRTGFDRNELSPQEKQKIEVIQLYPHFKIGEIWQDIRFDLDNMNIKPTSDDNHWMMTSVEEFEEMVFGVINTQSLIAREYRMKQEEDLSKFYEIIKSNKLAK